VGPTSWFNRYYEDAYPAAEREATMVHELGHALGLDHQGANLSHCSTVPIMYPSLDNYTVCGKITPQSDDINGINAIY
jgi:hypothetical protein